MTTCIVCVCVYVCVCICVCVYMCVCVYVCVCIMYIHVCVDRCSTDSLQVGDLH